MNWFNKLFSNKEIKLEAKVKELEEKLEEKSKPTAKEEATKKGEPYVNILEMEISKGSTGLGSFELDWNSYFIAYLREHGYEGRTDELIIDRWFTDVCRNVVLETYEQHAANNTDYVTRKKLDDGRTEIG